MLNGSDVGIGADKEGALHWKKDLQVFVSLEPKTGVNNMNVSSGATH